MLGDIRTAGFDVIEGPTRNGIKLRTGLLENGSLGS
jgi:hypothetical protein